MAFLPCGAWRSVGSPPPDTAVWGRPPDVITCMAIRDHQHNREDPHRTGLPIDPFKTSDQPLTSGARSVRNHKTFSLWTCNPHGSHRRTLANRRFLIGREHRRTITPCVSRRTKRKIESVQKVRKLRRSAAINQPSHSEKSVVSWHSQETCR